MHRLELDIDGVKTTAFDSTESRLAVVRRDGRARSDCIDIIDLAEKRVVASVGCRLSPNGNSIAWSPDGNFIAAVEEDGFRFYDASQLNSIASLEFRYACHVEFSADGRFVALGAWSGALGAWSGGYTSWAGGAASWTGSEPWSGKGYSNSGFVQNFKIGAVVSSAAVVSTGHWVDEP